MENKDFKIGIYRRFFNKELKEAIKLGLDAGEVMQTQTLVAISREEAIKLLGKI